MTGPAPTGAVRLLRTASAAYLVNAAAGTWLSVRDDLRGEPLGLATGWDVRTDLRRGFGAALSAPAPMLAAVALLLLRRRPLEDEPVVVATLAGLGAAFTVGMAAEPVAAEVVAAPAEHPARAAVVLGNLVLPGLMCLAGLRHLARRGVSRRRRR